MKERNEIQLDFIIDKLTNSIENIKTGDNFPTEISLLNAFGLKTVTKKNGWNFNWKNEFKQPEKDVYKLTIIGNPDIIQGLVSFGSKGRPCLYALD